MSKAEYNSFGRKLAFHTAPTLLGIKCASLFSLSSSEFDLAFHSQYFNRRTAALGLASRILCSCKNRSLILVYSREQLAKRLVDSSVKVILERYGYTSDMTVDECLDRLSERIGESESFPHEIGVFLGYPVEDVIGFIENKGENFKLCGAWKVYGSVENARRTFADYDRCRNFLCNKLNGGADIYQTLAHSKNLS